jgi:hypothetical protein
MSFNLLYDQTRERQLKAQLDWVNLSMLMLAYSFDPVGSYDPADLTQADIGTPVAVSQPLLNPLVMPGGYARTSYAYFPVVPVGAQVQFCVLAEVNATPANRRLLAFMGDVSGLPFTPNGGSYLIKPDWLFAQGWFQA